MKSTLTKEEIARQIPDIWEPLTDEQRQQLANQLVVRKYERDDIVYKEGDASTHLMCLLRGKVTIGRLGIGDHQHIVSMVAPGQLFAYHAAFENKPQLSTAIAGEDTTIALIPIELVFHFIWENNGFAFIFIKEMAALLGLSVQRTISLTQKHIRGRLAEALLSMKAKYGLERDGKTLAVYLSRSDLASMSNMTTSNAIRTLSSFAKEGLIALEDRRVQFLDEKKLQRISDMG